MNIPEYLHDQADPEKAMSKADDKQGSNEEWLRDDDAPATLDRCHACADELKDLWALVNVLELRHGGFEQRQIEALRTKYGRSKP